MRPSDDPSPDDRLCEIAAILAAGILRLHARAALPEKSQNRGLEVSAETLLTVHNG